MATFDDFMNMDIRVGEIVQQKFLKRLRSQPINYGLILVKRLAQVHPPGTIVLA
ncbi:csaA domain protein [Desulfosporosinus sp. OT]|uniref:csaA domain protein n=1 Tax=Desulfosporosinus sp. OT TaxID=913865 RepID=UPI000223A46F|nr:csaA domain protein [Desulfosporosinus sp. OT]EGW38569.1 csaA domain protein [Desulfosporosinus sp. OT]